MENQKLPSSPTKNYAIKRIDEEDIIISLQARDAILKELEKGARFIFIKDHVLMLNSIKSIDPIIETISIPPRPQAIYLGIRDAAFATQQKCNFIPDNIKEIEAWDKKYGDSENPYLEDGKKFSSY